MTRHRPAEILLMVLAVFGAQAILSLVGTAVLHPSARSTPPGTGAVAVSYIGLSAIVFSVLVIVAIIIAVTISFKSRG